MRCLSVRLCLNELIGALAIIWYFGYYEDEGEDGAVHAGDNKFPVGVSEEPGRDSGVRGGLLTFIAILSA